MIFPIKLQTLYQIMQTTFFLIGSAKVGKSEFLGCKNKAHGLEFVPGLLCAYISD